MNKLFLLSASMLFSFTAYTSCDLDYSYILPAKQLEFSQVRGIGVSFWEKFNDPTTNKGKAQLSLIDKEHDIIILNREYENLSDSQEAVRKVLLAYNVAMQRDKSIAICENDLDDIEFVVVDNQE